MIRAALLALSLAAGEAPACTVSESPAVMPRLKASSSAAVRSVLAGRYAAVLLQPIATVRFAVAPGHAAEPGAFGGMIAVDVRQGGRLIVELGDKSWVDLIEDGAALPSLEHGNPSGPCTTMRKAVTFAVRPGRHILQLVNAPAATARVSVKFAPAG